MKEVLTVTMDGTSIMTQSLKYPIKQRSPSLKTVRSMPTRQQHLPSCFTFFASCTSAPDMIHFYRKEWSA